MTAIACYFQREHDALFSWAAADTRVSQEQAGGGYKVLHDHAVKIFSIPFDVVSESDNKVVYYGSFGYCFSGSSLTALNSHAAFSHLVRVLRTPSRELPRLRDITGFVAGVLRQYVMSYGEKVGHAAGCECAVLGQCPVEGTQQIFLLRPNVRENDGLFDFKVEILDASIEGNFTLLGDEKNAVKQHIETARARATERSINWYRAPWHGIHDAIRSNVHPTIGGQMQIGFARGRFFEVVARSENALDDTNHGVPEFLGLNVKDEFWRIGPCNLGLPRMKGLNGFPLDKYP